MEAPKHTFEILEKHCQIFKIQIPLRRLSDQIHLTFFVIFKKTILVYQKSPVLFILKLLSIWKKVYNVFSLSYIFYSFFQNFCLYKSFFEKKLYFKKQIQLLVKTNKLLPQYDTQDSIDVSSDISISDKKMNHSSINKTVLLLPPRLIVSRGSSLGSANSSFDSPTSNHAG